MVDVPNNATTTAVLEFNADATVGTYSGRLDFDGDHDWIRVDLQAGIAYDFFLSTQRNGIANGDANFRLYDAAGVAVASNDDGGAIPNSFVQFTPAASGTYYIDASDLAGPRGTYSVLMTRVAATNVFGASSAQNLTVNAGERVAGGAGDDTIVIDAGGLDALGEQGNDTILGNPTQNRISGGLGSDYVSGSSGDDILFGDAGDDAINGGNDQDQLFGGDGFDDLDGGAGVDILNGGAGDDELRGGLGKDTMDGGAGFDIADYTGTSGPVTVTLNRASNATVFVGGVAEDTIRNIEGVTGGYGNDRLTGDALSNTLRGGFGDDTLVYAGGRDILDGGSGVDTVNFSAFGSAVWVNLGASGAEAWTRDLPHLNAGNWREIAEVSNVENLVGTAFDDFLRGDAAANTLFYTGGRDTLDGAGGVDTADFSRFGSAVWVSLGASGAEAWTQDTTNLSGGVWREIAGVEGTENLAGTAFDDLVRGDAGANTLFYTGGLDTLDGAGGVDTANFSRFGSAVWVDLANGKEAWTRDGADVVTGSWREIADLANIENLLGTANADLLRGNANANRLEGGAGNDTLTGRGGNDTFVFEFGFGNDAVTDFTAGPAAGDVIELFLGGAFDTFAEVLSAATQVGADVVLDFGANGQLTLGNTLLGNLANNDFLFA